MRFEYARGDERWRVDLTGLGDGRHRVRCARFEDADEVDAVELELHAHELGDGVYSLIVGDGVHDARVARDGDLRRVSLPSGDVVLEHLDPLRGVASGAGGAGHGPATVASPIPGRVVEVAIAAGDEVAEGQAVIVVEAMKMANELRSPMAGRVKSVNAAAGDPVEAGRALVVIEPLD